MKKAYSVISDINPEAVDLLQKNGISLTVRDEKEVPTTKEIIALLEDFDILIIGVKTKITKDILPHVRSPKIIATLSIGLDHIDKEIRESASPVQVINVKYAIAPSVAEHIFALILSLNKRIYESNNLVLHQLGVRNNLHERTEDIFNKTLGLIGAGNITKEVINIAKSFQMHIICYTKHPNNHKDLVEEGVEFKALDDILKESDIINVSIPLTNETEFLIDKEKIALIKPTATFINTSRTDVVDTKALMEKADQYPTFYVGLDIDIDTHKDLLAQYRNNVIVTPHTAGVSKQAIERMDFELAHHIIESLSKIGE